MKTYLYLILALLGIQSCAPVYTSGDFKKKTRDHERIAVIPAQVIFSGRIPNAMSRDDVSKIETAEGKAFQQSLYEALIARSGGDENDIDIEIQDPNRTHRNLEKLGWNINQIYLKDPELLADTLGVDAVLMLRIRKERFLSDFESYGIALGKDVLEKILEGIEGNTDIDVPGNEGPNNLERTYEVRYDCALYNKVDGSVLWRLNTEFDADWESRPEEIIEGLNRRSAKKFPYRKS